MKKVKMLFLITILFACTGCTVEYNININEDTVEETIVVNDYIAPSRSKTEILNDYNMWYPVFVNFVKEGETIELTDFSQKANGVEYYNKTINEIGNGYQHQYQYQYNIDDYYDSYALATTFIEPNIYNTSDTLVLKTSKENLLCNYNSFESLTINITVDPNVYKINTSNAQSTTNNTYTWVLNQSNCNDSKILLTLDRINSKITDKNTDDDQKTDQNAATKKKDYSLYIFCVALLILIFIGYKIFQKIKAKNEKFNIDD